MPTISQLGLFKCDHTGLIFDAVPQVTLMRQDRMHCCYRANLRPDDHGGRRARRTRLLVSASSTTSDTLTLTLNRCVVCAQQWLNTRACVQIMYTCTLMKVLVCMCERYLYHICTHNLVPPFSIASRRSLTRGRCRRERLSSAHH